MSDLRVGRDNPTASARAGLLAPARNRSSTPLPTRPLLMAGGAVALEVINFSDDDNFLRGINLHLKEAGAVPGWKARDLWAGKDLGPIRDDYKFVLKRYSSLLLRLTK